MDLSCEEFLRQAYAAPVIALDTEGTGVNVLDNSDFSYGVSLAYVYPGVGLISHYMPFRHRYGENLDPRYLHMLRDLLHAKAAEPGFVFNLFNYQYDVPALWTLGIDISDVTFRDGIVLAQLINENWPMSKSLETLCQYYLQTGKLEGPDPALWPVMFAEGLWQYAQRDAENHYQLDELLWQKAQAEELDKVVWPHKMQTLKDLLKMRKPGVMINQKLCEHEYSIGTRIMGEVQDELGYNPASSKDLKILLLDKMGLPVVKMNDPTEKQKTKGQLEGNPSFDKEAMEEYDEMLERLDSPMAGLVKTYRGWGKATSACYKSYLDRVSSDGRLRTNYHMHRTKTGRLSSSEPNLQQIPRESKKPWHGKVKHAFVGRPGYVLMEGDYSQLEFRLNAAYARQQSLIDIFNDPSRDVFTEMSIQLGMSRLDTKTLVYTLSYGGGVRRLKNVFNIPESSAASIRSNFYINYANLKSVSDYAAKKARQQGYVKLWSGRRRHFRNVDKEAHKAFNSVMQGGAADVVEYTINRLFAAGFPEDECRMLLQVHDSIVFEIREDLVDKYSPVIIDIMQDVKALNNMDFGVRFAVDLHPWAKAG